MLRRVRGPPLWRRRRLLQAQVRQEGPVEVLPVGGDCRRAARREPKRHLRRLQAHGRVQGRVRDDDLRGQDQSGLDPAVRVEEHRQPRHGPRLQRRRHRPRHAGYPHRRGEDRGRRRVEPRLRAQHGRRARQDDGRHRLLLDRRPDGRGADLRCRALRLAPRPRRRGGHGATPPTPPPSLSRRERTPNPRPFLPRRSARAATSAPSSAPR